LQAKLLRVLEEEEFERVGGNTTLKVDVRVIATTNRDLQSEVRAGRFREDLYYRLHVLPVHLAPLRERREDVLALAEHFAKEYAASNGRQQPIFAADARRRLEEWSWPGNVRELENAVQRAVVLMQGNAIGADLLPGGAGGAQASSSPSASPFGFSSGTSLANRRIDDIEREAILATLASTGNNKTEAARRLGVTARTLSNKMKLWRRLGLVA
jgi:two-component system response regulator HydG